MKAEYFGQYLNKQKTSSRPITSDADFDWQKNNTNLTLTALAAIRDLKILKNNWILNLSRFSAELLSDDLISKG